MKLTYSLIIAGSRKQSIDLEIIKTLYNKYFDANEIVSGKEPTGIDKRGEDFAKLISLPVKAFPANWDKYGRSAGHKRNKQMAEYADGLMTFWDMESPGTKSMIRYAQENDLEILVFDLNTHTYRINKKLKGKMDGNKSDGRGSS